MLGEKATIKYLIAENPKITVKIACDDFLDGLSSSEVRVDYLLYHLSLIGKTRSIFPTKKNFLSAMRILGFKVFEISKKEFLSLKDNLCSPAYNTSFVYLAKTKDDKKFVFYKFLK